MFLKVGVRGQDEKYFVLSTRQYAFNSSCIIYDSTCDVQNSLKGDHICIFSRIFVSSQLMAIFFLALLPNIPHCRKNACMFFCFSSLLAVLMEREEMDGYLAKLIQLPRLMYCKLLKPQAILRLYAAKNKTSVVRNVEEECRMSPGQKNREKI